MDVILIRACVHQTVNLLYGLIGHLGRNAQQVVEVAREIEIGNICLKNIRTVYPKILACFLFVFFILSKMKSANKSKWYSLMLNISRLFSIWLYWVYCLLLYTCIRKKTSRYHFELGKNMSLKVLIVQFHGIFATEIFKTIF